MVRQKCEIGPAPRRGWQPAVVSAMVLLVAALALGCGEPPELKLDVEPTLDLPDSIPVGQPFEVGYRWTPGEAFTPPADDYKVFVHLAEPDGTIFMQDDHYPPLPTSQWRAGEPVTYKRWIYPPSSVQPEYIELYVGLYQEAENSKIAVKSGGEWNERPSVHRMYVRTDQVAGLPVNIEGWHEKEVSPTSPTESWIWMERSGTVAFGNPRGPAILHLRAHSPIDEVGGPQKVTILFGGRELTALEITEPAPFLKRIPVPRAALGDDDWVEVTLSVDKTFVPGELYPDSEDTRELGLLVYDFYLAPDSSS
ncbi:MAG: hypothetical protein ACE5HV_11915 [Acidobacteriota bacterium]